jgi:hypothetical protein
VGSLARSSHWIIEGILRKIQVAIRRNAKLPEYPRKHTEKDPEFKA